jgi:hypothetical protein
MPPTQRRPSGRWIAAVAAVAVAVTTGGVLMAVAVDDSARPAGTAEADRTATPSEPAPTGLSGAAAPTGTSGPSVSVTPRVPGPPPAATAQWLWPFADRADVARWQQAYRQGGHQPWHLDAATTALGFAGYLGYGGIDRVVRSTVDGQHAYVAIGFALPDGTRHTAADVHLVRAGTGRDAPWEVVGTRDTTLTLDRPAYGSTATSPMTVGGRITGVDERVVVTLRAQSGDVQASPAAVAAGGNRSPWSVRVRFSSRAGSTITVAAATGGHVAAVERFAVTGVRTGAASPVTADIDGDGRQDVASIPASGRLQVRYGSGRTDTVAFAVSGGEASLQGIVDADGDGRDEVFVHVGTGASTDQTSVFRYVAGRLQVVALDGHQLQLVSGASVRHANSWACRPPATPVVQWSGTSTDGLTYRGTEISYRFSGATLVPVSTRSLTVDDTTSPPTGCAGMRTT